MEHITKFINVFIVIFCLAFYKTIWADITIVKDGIANAVIYVSAEIMSQSKNHEKLRASVQDLSYYIEKISSARIEILTNLSERRGKAVPILVGDIAQKAFGAPEKKSPYKQSFRILISEKGMGFIGESDEAVSYAIYEFLDMIGCRWYIPSELGEVIPHIKTITLKDTDISLIPATILRNIWCEDEDFKRRNRLGGIDFNASHALEGYVSSKQLQEHPDWNAEVKGKRSINGRLCWANPEVSNAIADEIISYIEKYKRSCVSLSPEDGTNFCECDKCKLLDANDWDTRIGSVSITDRYIYLCNQIAEKVGRKYPDVVFGFLAYAEYTRPPVKVKPHPNLIPQITPITYCRAHSMLDSGCRSRLYLRKIVKDWSEKSRILAYSEFAYNLAEVSAPNPMIRKWKEDLPFVYANNVTIWTPQTMPNFESCMPGLYLGIRLSWFTKANPDEILNEFYDKFYGSASAYMREYWETIDSAWTGLPEHSGCAFGYPRRFTTETLSKARNAINNALSSCKTITEYRRVKLAEECLTQFELFMKMRRDYFDGNFANIENDIFRWVGSRMVLGEQYKQQYAFTYMPGVTETWAGRYMEDFFYFPYIDGKRITTDFNAILPPIRIWKYEIDRGNMGEKQGWNKDNFNDVNWKITDACLESWSYIGLEDYYGTVWYRAKIKLPAIPEGKRIFLWVGSTDGSAKVFVNGKHVPFVNENGETQTEFSGYCQPASFDITADVNPNSENQIAIVCARRSLNELGTGGLLGPVIVYYEKPQNPSRTMKAPWR